MWKLKRLPSDAWRALRVIVADLREHARCEGAKEILRALKGLPSNKRISREEATRLIGHAAVERFLNAEYRCSECGSLEVQYVGHCPPSCAVYRFCARCASKKREEKDEQ